MIAWALAWISLIDLCPICSIEGSGRDFNPTIHQLVNVVFPCLIETLVHKDECCESLGTMRRDLRLGKQEMWKWIVKHLGII